MTNTNGKAPPRSITADQINRIQKDLSVALRKIPRLEGPMQQVIEHQGDELTSEIVSMICRRAEMFTSMIRYRVKVDRGRAPQEMLADICQQQHMKRSIDNGVVSDMPRGEGDDIVTIFFFRAPRLYIGDNDGLEKKHKLRGLRPDPYALITMNERNPDFAYYHPNCTCWKDNDGNWCCVAFQHSLGEWGFIVRSVRVFRADSEDQLLDGPWSFGGIC